MAEIQNYSVCASGVAKETPDNIVSMLLGRKNIPKDAELVIVWLGTNDWYWGSQMGTLGSRDVFTFLGGVNAAVKMIRKAEPKAVFVWLTPPLSISGACWNRACGKCL